MPCIEQYLPISSYSNLPASIRRTTQHRNNRLHGDLNGRGVLLSTTQVPTENGSLCFLTTNVGKWIRTVTRTHTHRARVIAQRVARKYVQVFVT